jgi:HEAT repeat protein
MRAFYLIPLLVFLASPGCHDHAPSLGSNLAAGNAQSPPASTVAGEVPSSEKVPLEGLELKLEPAGGRNPGLPESLRLVVSNPGTEMARFIAPGPFCVAATEGDRKIRYPILRCVFWDAEGNEGDTTFGPGYADVEAPRAPPPEEVTVRPGGAWSREYPTSSFVFLGPCGPAANVEDLLRPGDVVLKMAVELVEFRHPASEEVEEGPMPGVAVATIQRRTNAITVKVAEAPGIFRRYTEDYQAQLLSVEDTMEREGQLATGAPAIPPEGIPRLLRLFDGPEFSAHLTASGMLVRLGPQAKAAVPRMVVLLGSSKLYGDRVLAARVLGAIGPAAAAEAIPALQAALQDRHGHVRQEAAAALAKLEGKPAPEAIDPETGDPLVWGEPLRYWIGKMRMGDRGPHDRDFEESGRARQALELLGVKAVPRLLASLRGDHETVFPATLILRKITDPAGLELIAGALEHDDVLVRRGAADALAPSDSPIPNPFNEGPAERFGETIIAALAKALRDPDSQVRRHAARALGRPDARGAAGALAAAVAGDAESGVRAAAAKSLGAAGVGSKEGLEALGAAAKQGPASVRGAAAGALAALGEMVPPVEDAAAALRERVEREGAVEIQTAQAREMVRAPGDPEAVFFVLANGGSNVRELPGTKEMVVRMIESLPQGAEFGVFFYSARLLRYPAGDKPARADETGKREGIEFVRSARPGSGSCIRLGFDAALDMIDAASAQKVTIVYAGNGYPTCPGKDPQTYETESLEEITRHNHGRAAIHTFAWEECNDPFLRRLAAMNSGSFTRLSR